MTPAASVLVCALSLLGRSAESLPAIELVAERPPDATPTAEAFVRVGQPVIYLITSSPNFRAAQLGRDRCGDRQALKKLASIIVHEEWHIIHGSDERGAYHAQLTTLVLLGEGPGTPLYSTVVRSMLFVLEARRRAPAGT